jgi:MFS family permease
MVAEMVPERELQPRAFSIMPLVWSLGSIFGPSFGGFFAKPAENLPGLFGHNKFLTKFPFALPNIVASALFLVGISTGFLYLKARDIPYPLSLVLTKSRKPSRPNVTAQILVSSSGSN